MIGQYLSNTNESATVSIFQKFSELNKAKEDRVLGSWIDHARPVTLVVRLYKKKKKRVHGAESLPHYESTTISGRFPGNNARRCIIALLAGLAGRIAGTAARSVPPRTVRAIRCIGLDRFRAAMALAFAFALRQLDLNSEGTSRAGAQ